MFPLDTIYNFGILAYMFPRETLHVFSGPFSDKLLKKKAPSPQALNLLILIASYENDEEKDTDL